MWRCFPSVFVQVCKGFEVTEIMAVHVRTEPIHLTNTPILGAPSKCIGTGELGVIGRPANSPRQIRLFLRLTF